MNGIDNLALQLQKTINEKNKNKKTGYDTQAEVVKVEDNTIWVKIPGGVDETPVAKTTSAKPGDTVQVRVSGGRAWVVGNYTSPPTDDARANAAYILADDANEIANIAKSAAESAIQDAGIARAAAESAQADADSAHTAAESAQNSLKSVVQGATTVEKAVSVMQTALEAVVDYDPTNDTVQEYFWHDANGAHVLGDTSGYRNDTTSSGMKIVTVSDEESVAEFGADGSVIGKTDGSQSYLYEDYHSLQLIDKDGATYFHVSDLRGADGYADIVETFYGDAYATVFEVNLPIASVTNVKIDDTATTAYSRSGKTFTFTTAPAYDAVIKIAYKTTSPEAKAYSLGERNANEDIGAYSIAIGQNVTASGPKSVAMGVNTKSGGYASTVEGVISLASGDLSHAEGYNTEAYGYASHAEGFGTAAVGKYSHAQNQGTIAYTDHQTVLGRFNDPDDGNSSPEFFAVQIGNGTGTAHNSRSNALSVAWTGDVNIPSGARYKVNHVAMPVIVFEDFTQNSISVSSNGTETVTINVAKTGYTPMGIIRIHKSGTGHAGIVLNRFQINGNEAQIGLTNDRNTERTVNISITVLYVLD